MDKRITTDTVMMPRELTTENGAKGLFIGEFYATSPSGERSVIEWTTIKEIYAMAVDKLGR